MHSVASHNSVLQIVYYYGAVGLVLICGVVLLLLFKAIKKHGFCWVNFIPAFVYCIDLMALDNLTSMRTPVFVYLVGLSLVLKSEEDNVELKSKPCIKPEDFKEEVVLSVVIPMYNTSKYINKCVESLTNLNLIKTEILLIDDGSTDDTALIAKKIADNHPNVLLHKKTNGGLGDARNYGIKQARGKYVVVIDSDDYVEKEFEQIYEHLNEYYDVIFTGMNVEYIKNKSIIQYNQNSSFVGNDNVVKNCLKICTNKNSACSKIIKKDFITRNNLYFGKGFSEDFNWLGRAMCYMQSGKLTNLVYYHYIAEREGSLMNSYKFSHLEDVIKQARSIENVCKESNLTKKAKKRIMQYIGFNIVSIFRNIKKLNDADKVRAVELLNSNYDLVKNQKQIYMKCFVWAGKIFGFDFVYKII